MFSFVVDHILQEFHTWFLTRFRTYKIATPPQIKTPVKTTFRDWYLFSSFVHGYLDTRIFLSRVAYPISFHTRSGTRSPFPQKKNLHFF